jgi:adenine C2-methylase RlmN of 23S rRNA A2503 and tRNA A37
MKGRTLLRVLQNGVPKKEFEFKRAVIEEGTDFVKIIYIRHGILFRDQTKQDEMRGACGTYEGQEKCIQVFDGKI